MDCKAHELANGLLYIMENLENEIWLPIDGFPNYEISNKGRVKSLPRKIISGKKGSIVKYSSELVLKPLENVRPNGKIYLQVFLTGRKRFYIHRLVALHFVDNPYNKPEINHINGNPSFNWDVNLEWCTRSENGLHSFRVLKNKASNTEITINIKTGEEFASINEAYHSSSKKIKAGYFREMVGGHYKNTTDYRLKKFLDGTDTPNEKIHVYDKELKKFKKQYPTI